MRKFYIVPTNPGQTQTIHKIYGTLEDAAKKAVQLSLGTELYYEICEVIGETDRGWSYKGGAEH